jgi:ferredoxin
VQPPIDARLFSGTGNTLRAARWFAGEGGDVRTLDAPGATTLRDGAMLLLATPTHGFTAPWSVVRFAWSLPAGKGRPAAVLCTRAGLCVGPFEPPGVAGTAPFLLALVLWLRGYRVRGAASVNMPSNWTTLHPGLSPASVTRLLATGERDVRAFSTRLSTGRGSWFTANLAYELVFGLLLAPVSLLYVLFAGRMLGQYFFASPACTRCGQCALACPAGAITMEGQPARPAWSTACTSCMRCMAYCPSKAIEVSWVWGLVSTALSVLPALAWWAAFGVPHPTGLPVFDWALLSVAYLVFSAVVLAPLTRLVWRLRGAPRLNRVAMRLSPSHWWRRYREPNTRLKELSVGMTKRRT